jgi:hypothetical protein
VDDITAKENGRLISLTHSKYCCYLVPHLEDLSLTTVKHNVDLHRENSCLIEGQPYAFAVFPQSSKTEGRCERDYLFFSNPIRNAASANEARRLPLPASIASLTAYSLTNT